LPPTVPWERISKSATFAAHGPSGEPRVAEQERRRRLDSPVGEVREDDRASGDDDDACAVPERRDGVLLGTRDYGLGRGVDRHARSSHTAPTLLGREVCVRRV
jgi:hypothetical protein